MRRCSSGFLLIVAVSLALTLTACLGKSTPGSSGTGVQSVSLSPSVNFSMDIGTTQVFSATAKNAAGHTIIGSSLEFSVTVPPGTTSPAPRSIATNGNACAGTWDAAVAVCTPGAPGIALVTAVVNGVSSPPTTVYVHQHIDSLQVVQAEPQPPQYNCFSQGQTWIYKAVAYSKGVDITSTVGELTWATTNTGVLTTTEYEPPNQPNVLNEIQITAASPGITNLYAAVSGTASTPIPLTTCLIQYVRVRAQGLTGNSLSVNNTTSFPINATAVDTLGYTLAKPPLTWSTTDSEVVAFSSYTNSTGTNNATARNNLGGADVTVSCSPPTCNIGILPALPIYASTGLLPNGLQGYGAISVNVTSTSPVPTYTAWAATDQCGNVSGCVSTVFRITPGTTNNPITATATMPRTPNSFMFNYQTRIYIGSAQGLMYMDVASSPTVNPVSSATTPCNVILCGKVLTISNDGKQVVISDNVSVTPHVYIYNSGAATGVNPVTDLVLPNVATAAAFSPDQSTIFLLTDAGTMFVYSIINALAPVPIPTSGTDVAFAADGSFAYVTGSLASAGEVAAYSTCATPTAASTELGAAATSGVPLQIFASPNLPPSSSDLVTQNVYVLEPPNVQALSASFTQTPINNNEFNCIPPAAGFTLTAGNTYNLGQGAFTPLYARIAGDGSELLIVGKNIPAVMIFNIASGTTSAIPLVNKAFPYSASASSDGSQVYVAACDQFQNNDPTQACLAGSVHVVSTIGQGDYQQVPFINNTTNNMCNNLGGSAPVCVPDLVAINPL